MGSLAATQQAHYWNACTRALQAGGRCGALAEVLPPPGADLTSLVHLPAVAALAVAHAAVLTAGALEGQPPPPPAPQRRGMLHLPPFASLHHPRTIPELPAPHLLTRLLQRSLLEPKLSAMPATMLSAMVVFSQQPAQPLAPRYSAQHSTFFQEQQPSSAHVRPPAPHAWLHHNATHTMDFTQYPKEGPHGSPHGDTLWRALIAVHLGLPLPDRTPPWHRKEHCRVRGCGQELDARGHHRAACSAALGGERTQHHHEVVHYLAGQLRRAGFPCTDKDGDIPQHPSAQIGGPQHQHVDIYVPGFLGSALGHRTVIDVVRAHSYNRLGELRATIGVPRRLTAPANAVKAKYTKHYAPYRGMGIGFCAFGASTDGGLEPDACRLLKHLSYARTTRDFEARGLDADRRDLDEYRRASAKTFRHILMNCTLLLSLTGIRQRLPNPLPDPGLWL